MQPMSPPTRESAASHPIPRSAISEDNRKGPQWSLKNSWHPPLLQPHSSWSPYPQQRSKCCQEYGMIPSIIIHHLLLPPPPLSISEINTLSSFSSFFLCPKGLRHQALVQQSNLHPTTTPSSAAKAKATSCPQRAVDRHHPLRALM